MGSAWPVATAIALGANVAFTRYRRAWFELAAPTVVGHNRKPRERERHVGFALGVERRMPTAFAPAKDAVCRNDDLLRRRRRRMGVEEAALIAAGHENLPSEFQSEPRPF